MISPPPPSVEGFEKFIAWTKRQREAGKSLAYGVTLKGSDVVIDPVGGDVAEPALRSLRYGGRFVTIGFAAGAIPRIPLNLVLLKGITVTGFEIGSFLTRQREEADRTEAELLALLVSGRTSPHISASFGLAQAADALRHVGSGQAIGKVVLDVTDAS